jgi:hypothetical protein
MAPSRNSMFKLISVIKELFLSDKGLHLADWTVVRALGRESPATPDRHMELGSKKPPENERSRAEVLAAHERGVMILLFILAVAILALVIWLAVYLFSL